MRVETIGAATLYLGDCLEVLPSIRLLSRSSAHRPLAVITDPPYGMNLNTDYSGFNGWGGKGTEFNKRGDGKPSEICFGDCELAWANVKQSVRMYSQVWHGVSRWSSEGRHHPTQKSVGLMSWCIEQAGRPKTVVDPYMGSGTTGVAAMQMGVDFIGCEIDPAYFDIACRRIEQAYAQRSLFPDPPPTASGSTQMELT